MALREAVMAAELVTIQTAGAAWTAFEHVRVSAHFTHAARSFHFLIAAEAGPALTMWTFAAGTPVDILLSGDLACRGYVDRYEPEIVGHYKANVSIFGRSRSQDFIDSSAMHATGEFKNKTVAEIGRELDIFGVGIATDQQLPKVPVYRITPGEGAFAAVEKLARSAGVWASGQADGSILITVAGNGRNAPLIEGQNIKSAKADFNWANRHSRIIVRGQRPLGHGKQSTEIEEVAEDDEIGRDRPKLLIEDADTDENRAKTRARHRRDSEAGNSIRAHVMVQGFHDNAGGLWTPGFLTFLDSPFLQIGQDMAIDAVEFLQDRKGGSVTHLSLVDPRALGAKSGRKGGKAEQAWTSGAGDD